MKNGEPRDPSEIAVFSFLSQGLRDLGSPAGADQIARLTRLTFLLSEWAGRISLTGHREPMEMAGRLVLDAAALSMALPELASVEMLSDLGSGVGFPGIPIAILHPDLRVNLIESRSRRHHLQKQLKRVLGIENIRPILGRSDEIPVVPSDLVVAQAMTEPSEAIRLMQGWCRPGGMIILPASETAPAPRPPDGFGAPGAREYRVPGADRIRRLWVLRSGAHPSGLSHRAENRHSS